jgi:hypothetical protein
MTKFRSDDQADGGKARNDGSSTLSERRFVLLSQYDSFTGCISGWNAAGGPFANQWLFQAVESHR